MTTQELVPDWAKSRPPQGFETLDPEESLGEGIGSSYPIIGYKGKIWSIRHQGQNHILTRPDDGTPIGYIDVVILRSPKTKAKSYYPDGYEDNSSAGKRPTCASMDGVRPDPDVLQRQAELCAMCKHNEFYTDKNGRKTRDCSDYKRLAVLVMPNQTTPLFGEPLMIPAFLRVPPASLQKLLTFGDNMAKQGWPYSSFVTRISFDAQKAHPEFSFKALQGLTPAEAPVILQLREDVTSKRITGEDEISRREKVQLGAPPVSQQPKVDVRALAPVQEANPGLLASLPKPEVTAPVIEMKTNPQGAFSIALPLEANPTPQPGSLVGQTAADVGSAVEDADLDAKIAAMLATA